MYNGMETWRDLAEVACLPAVEDKHKEQRQGLLYNRAAVAAKQEQKGRAVRALRALPTHCYRRLPRCGYVNLMNAALTPAGRSPE